MNSNLNPTKCPFCLEEIKAGALKCKHCGSTIVDSSQLHNSTLQKENGTLWLPLPSMIIGIICFMALLDDSDWDADTFVGAVAMAIASLTLGIISLSVQKLGKGMAITGIVLSSIALLAIIGLALE